jgi:hypothetical protein
MAYFKIFLLTIFLNSCLYDKDEANTYVAKNYSNLEIPFELKEGGYQLFSIPNDQYNSSVEELFYDDWGPPDPLKWRLFEYDSTFIELKGEDSISPGKAYWLRTRGFDPNITLNEENIKEISTEESFSIPLRPKWNCFSNPFLFDVSLSDVYKENNIKHIKICGFENGEWLTSELFNNLVPWRGYMLWNIISDGDHLQNISIPPKRSEKPQGYLPNLGIWIGISVVDGNGNRDGLIIIGFNYSGSIDSLDFRDYPKPEIIYKEIEIGLNVGWDPANLYLTDYRGELSEGKAWLLSITGSARDVEIRITNLEKIPKGTNAAIIDRWRSMYYNPAPSQFTTVSDNQLEIIIGIPEFIENRIDTYFKLRTQ